MMSFSVDPLGTSCRVVTSLELDTADADDVTRGTAKMADATDQAWQARFRVVIIFDIHSKLCSRRPIHIFREKKVYCPSDIRTCHLLP